MTDASRYQFVPVGAGPTIVGGDGCWLIADDGRRILDAAGGAIVVNIGHGRREVADAVRDALDGGAYVIPLWSTPTRLELRDELVEHWLPPSLPNVYFTSGGSESADSAIRLARAHHVACGRPQRWKVVGRHPSYHGLTVGALAAGSHDRRRTGFDPLLLDFPKIPWDDADAALKVIEAEDPDTIAAVLFEPITGAAGACLEADDEYWGAIEDVCRRHDILLVADEVMTGFGRTGRMWGHEHVGFVPDVVYGGKGLGGGYVAMGMVAATDAVVEPLLAGSFMYFTFTATDAACAGALAVLRILRNERLVERAAAMGDVLGRRLDDALGEDPGVRQLRGRGLFRGIELVSAESTAPGALTAAVVAECLANDVWVYPAGSGPVPDAVMLGPPFVVTDAEVEQIVDTLAEAITTVTATS